jgi:hypothetical protein
MPSPQPPTTPLDAAITGTTRRRIAPIVALLLASLASASVAAGAAAQVSSLPASVVATSSQLSPRDRQVVGAFVSEWSARLAGGDPADVTRARAELISPARAPAATPVFLRAYSEEVLQALAPTIAADDTFRAINALQVLRFLRTPEAVEAIASRCDQAAEPNRGKRQAASSLLGPAISATSFTPAQLDGLTRRIGAMAAGETQWMTLLQLLRTLQAIAAQPGLPAASADLARSTFATALRTTTTRATAADGDPQLIHAVQRSLLGIREQFVRLGGGARQEFARQMAPVIETIRTATAGATGRAPADLQPTFRATTELAEQLAGLMRG